MNALKQELTVANIAFCLMCDITKLIPGTGQSLSLWQLSGVHDELWVNVRNNSTLNNTVWCNAKVEVPPIIHGKINETLL